MLKQIESELHAIAREVSVPPTEGVERPVEEAPPTQDITNSPEPVHAAAEYIETIVQEEPIRDTQPHIETIVQRASVKDAPQHVETIVRDESEPVAAQLKQRQQRLPNVEELTPPAAAASAPSPLKLVEPDPAITELLIYKNGRADETLEEKARPARRFVEGTRLLGVLNRISRWKIPAEVTHIEFPTLLISPENNAFVAADDVLSMPAMFRDSAMSFAIEDLPEDVADAMLTSGRLRPLSHLIYCAALFGSEGRLMLNSNTEDHLSLIGTPNFNVVPHLPEHKTIARYMMTEDTDLAGIAEKTSVNPSIVIDFCNACEAIGLVRRVPDSGFRQSTSESGVQQLLGRVRDMFKDS